MGRIVVGVTLLLVITGGVMGARAPTDEGVASSEIQATPVTTKGAGCCEPAARQRIYAYYYLWWSRRHWHDRLGPNYPYAQDPLPLPATLGEDGCHPVSRYEGNQLTDVPPVLSSQDDPGVIERHVRIAAGAGLAGFIVNWAGTGRSDQSPDSSSYNSRLAEVVRAVEELNDEGIPFKLWISYKASATILSVDHILNDWRYLKRTYASSSAFDRFYSDRPFIVWTGSRKYPRRAVRLVSRRLRSTFLIIGDENWDTWNDRAQFFDGDTYYWSSQNPYTNPSSFAQIERLARLVRSSGPTSDGGRKLWFAPLAPGYDSILLGGSTCVPRRDGRTMRRLFAGNAASNPDGWALISWNEIAEGTYVESLRRWGPRYLHVLSDLIGTG